MTDLKKKVCICLFIAVFLSSLCSCTAKMTETPKQIFESLQKNYGDLPAGLYLDSQAEEWEDNYLADETIEAIFGDIATYKKGVEEGYLYLSASLDSYEEIVVLKCYTSDKARQMCGIFQNRVKMLAALEEEKLEAEIVCRGRYMIYCRLSNAKRMASALSSLK